MPSGPIITGTFLDEITHDIPSQNWSREDWDREFELYTQIGIDTVIVIRAGYKDKCIFPAKSVPDLLPVKEDLGQIFVDLAEKHSLKIFWGLFDSGNFWMKDNPEAEIELNKPFIEELAAKYGGSPSFCGWYICHETSRDENHIGTIFNELGKHCKQTVNAPVLISPFPQGVKQFGADAIPFWQSRTEWQAILDQSAEHLDIVAFQDGQIHYSELPEFYEIVSELAEQYSLQHWANVESFDRDMPIKFPPADWRMLELKLYAAAKHVEKIITFEFPHFMSPHSAYPAAHNLYRRYRSSNGN